MRELIHKVTNSSAIIWCQQKHQGMKMNLTINSYEITSNDTAAYCVYWVGGWILELTIMDFVSTRLCNAYESLLHVSMEVLFQALHSKSSMIQVILHHELYGIKVPMYTSFIIISTLLVHKISRHLLWQWSKLLE